MRTSKNLFASRKAQEIAKNIKEKVKRAKNKKVLLPECKRHTARRVASARYAGGGGVVPHPVMVGGGTSSSHSGGGYPIQSWWGSTPGTPYHPDLARGYPRYPLPSRPEMGYPPTIQTWDGVPPTQARTGYPPPTDLGWGTPTES